MRIVSVNIGKKKGIAKTPVESAVFKENHGIIGDAHAEPGDRQISLLAQEDVEEFKKSPNLKGCLHHGVFGENIITEGIALSKLPIGTKLKINDVVLQISKIGKECHVPCHIYRKAGDCIMPKKGVFARVLNGGEVKSGDGIINIRE